MEVNLPAAGRGVQVEVNLPAAAGGQRAQLPDAD